MDAGNFTTYEAFSQWLINHYSPADPVNTSRDKFLNTVQRENKDFDSYFDRFKTARNLLDEIPSQSWVIFHFVNQLLPRYRAIIRGDKEFATYKNVTLDDVLAKLKRMNPTLVTSQHRANIEPTNIQRRSFDNDNQSSQPLKRRKISSSSGSSSIQHNTTPLTDGEKKFLDNNIKRGGGILLRESVQNNAEWIQQARKEWLCIKCASKGHYSRECTATRQSSMRFNAISESELERLNESSQE